jgi:antitoxin YefM
MITGIREITTVKEGGKIEISSLSFPIGTKVEVLILAEDCEQDTTEYLLSTEANRRHLEESIRDSKNTEKLTYVDISNL